MKNPHESLAFFESLTFTQLAFASLSLTASDIWGHVGLSVSTDVFPADVFVMFGGMHSELYFASASNDVNEFVRGLAPRPNDLVLWQPMSIGTGPFYRIQHTLVKHGDPRMFVRTAQLDRSGAEMIVFSSCIQSRLAHIAELKSVNGCPCEQKRPYVINNVEYVGCARPLGWDDYICPVAPGNCPLAQCIDDSMVLLKVRSVLSVSLFLFFLTHSSPWRLLPMPALKPPRPVPSTTIFAPKTRSFFSVAVTTATRITWAWQIHAARSGG